MVVRTNVRPNAPGWVTRWNDVRLVNSWAATYQRTKTKMKKEHFELLSPSKLCASSDISQDSSVVPQMPGVYAWYFRQIPPLVPEEGCHTLRGLTLLYVGIAPRKPPKGKTEQGTRTLRDRLKLAVKRNADVSTLRLSLGCLLSEHLGLQLRRVGNENVMTFAGGERELSQWIAQNTFVAWTVTTAPWVIEEELLLSLSLPLNIKGNSRHPFCRTLKLMRKGAKQKARELPILTRNGSQYV